MLFVPVLIGIVFPQIPAMALEAQDPESAPSGRPAQVVTLQQALVTFRSHGFDLLLADAATESARADALIAGAIPNPALSGGIMKTFGGPTQCAGCSEVGFNVGLSDQAALEDSLSGKRSLRMSIGQAAYEAAKLSRKDAQRMLEFAVKQQYVETALAKALVEFAAQVQKSNADTLALNQIRYNKGAISEADLAKIETAKLESDQALDTARLTLRASQILLSFLLGSRQPTPEFDVDESVLHAPPPPGVTGASTEALVEQALKNRPDLLASRRQVERAESALSLAHRLRFPDITLSAGYTMEGFGNQGALTPPTLSISLSAPIPVLYQQQGEIAKASSDLQAQTVTNQKTEAQVVSDVQTAHASVTSSKRLVDRMESSLLERSTRVRDLVQVQYQKGAASLLEYLDAQRTFVATNVEYLQDLTTYRVALFQLEQALGGNLQ